MKAILQRVCEAEVQVHGDRVARIGPGLLALIGIAPDDSTAEGTRLLERILGYRLFPDAQGRMNASLNDTGGELLLVPNFTLMADTRKGSRPGFSPAAAPDHAAPLFRHLVEQARQRLPERYGAGLFGADMQVSLINDGPVTILMEVSGRGA